MLPVRRVRARWLLSESVVEALQYAAALSGSGCMEEKTSGERTKDVRKKGPRRSQVVRPSGLNVVTFPK